MHGRHLSMCHAPRLGGKHHAMMEVRHLPKEPVMITTTHPKVSLVKRVSVHISTLEEWRALTGYVETADAHPCCGVSTVDHCQC
jgi:hypothetical protein